MDDYVNKLMEDYSAVPNTANANLQYIWDYGGGAYQGSPQRQVEVVRIAEEDGDLVGYTSDNVRVVLGEFATSSLSLRIRVLLEKLAGGESLTPEELERFQNLKAMHQFETEELELAGNRLSFIERLIAQGI